MEQRSYQGAHLSAEGLAQALLDEWDRDDTVAQAFGDEQNVVVQIGQRQAGWLGDEPKQALTVEIHDIGDGLQVRMGQQQWLSNQEGKVYIGGLIGFFPFFFTLPLGRLFGGGEEAFDHGLPGRVWQTIERYTTTAGAATGATIRLSARPCPECGVSNANNAQYCSACGTQLNAAAPQACYQCGNQPPPGSRFCNQCGAGLG